MIVIAIIGILALIAVPNLISSRNLGFCSRAETDAKHIATAITEFFSNPNETDLPSCSDLSGFNPSNGCDNVAISGNPNETITVTVTDGSDRCPNGSKYQLSMPAAANDGWLAAAETTSESQ